MFVASDYPNRIFLGHDLIKPRLNTWKLLYQLVLNTLNDRSFQLDTVGHILLLIKFLEHVSRWTWRRQRRAGNGKEILWERVRQMPLPADGRHHRPVAAVVANRKATQTAALYGSAKRDHFRSSYPSRRVAGSSDHRLRLSGGGGKGGTWAGRSGHAVLSSWRENAGAYPEDF